MNETPRREIVALLLDRTAELIKEDAPAGHLAARLLAGQFARDDKLYHDEFCLTGDHALNATLDAVALQVAEYVFLVCNYVKIAADIHAAAVEHLTTARETVAAAPVGS